MPETRRAFLDKLLGRKAVGTILESLMDELAKAGIATKSHEALTANEKAIMEELVAKVEGLIGELTDEPKPDLVNQIIAAVMGTLAGMEEEAPVEEPVEEEPEMMQEDEEEEEDEDIPEALMELSKEVTRLSEESTDTLKAVGEIIQMFTETMQVVNPVLPQLKTVGDLTERIKKLERQFAMRPRASQSPQTIIDNDAAAKELTEDEFETVLGLKVKKEA